MLQYFYNAGKGGGDIDMDLNRLCPGCMSELTDAQNQSICPYCGYRFDKEQEEPAHRLKPHTVLNGKYVIGKVLG